MSATRIFLIASLLALATAVVLMARLQPSAPSVAARAPLSNCEPNSTGLRFSGPALSPKQVEEIVLQEARRQGITLDDPFGSNNANWVAFKKEMQPGDSIFKYSEGPGGGYAIVRGYCVVDTLLTWIS